MSRLILNENLKSFFEIFKNCEYIKTFYGYVWDVSNMYLTDLKRDNLNMITSLNRIKKLDAALDVLTNSEEELKRTIRQKVMDTLKFYNDIKKQSEEEKQHYKLYKPYLKIFSWQHFKKYLLINYNKDLKTEIFNPYTQRAILANYYLDVLVPERVRLDDGLTLDNFITDIEHIAERAKNKIPGLYDEFLIYTQKIEFWQLVAPVYFEFYKDTEEVRGVKSTFIELFGAPEHVINNLILRYKNKALKIKIQY